MIGQRTARFPYACLLAVACCFPSSAFAADPALYEAAKREGEVVWYTTLIVNQAVRPLIETFNKRYPGINVKYVRADSGPTAIKIMNEARAACNPTCSTGSTPHHPCSPPAWSNVSCHQTQTTIQPNCEIRKAAGMRL